MRRAVRWLGIALFVLAVPVVFLALFLIGLGSPPSPSVTPAPLDPPVTPGTPSRFLRRAEMLH